mmetsp:Transcript_24887/g.57641  ORF Transcript_24887/g.57641 Transcript_24887/m.57641 type:complete len:218 (+) Transcript_24887:2250-2903(+)
MNGSTLASNALKYRNTATRPSTAARCSATLLQAGAPAILRRRFCMVGTRPAIAAGGTFHGEISCFSACSLIAVTKSASISTVQAGQSADAQKSRNSVPGATGWCGSPPTPSSPLLSCKLPSSSFDSAAMIPAPAAAPTLISEGAIGVTRVPPKVKYPRPRPSAISSDPKNHAPPSPSTWSQSCLSATPMTVALPRGVRTRSHALRPKGEQASTDVSN